MTELATRGPNAELTMPVMPGATGIANLEAWVAALGHANQIASFMANSNFVPLPLRQKSKGVFKSVDELTMDVTAIIMAGASVGYDPFQAVQQMFIVHGSPAMYARSMVALVKSHGHKVDQLAASAQSVTVRARHRDESDWQEFTWDMDRANRAGYTSNPKYKTNPQEMLYAKAATEACRRMFPEVLAGISPYSVEESELEDLGEAPSAPAPAAPAAKPATRKVTRARPAAPAPVAPAVIHDAPEPEAETEGDEAFDTATGEAIDEGTPAALEVNYFDEIEARAGDVSALTALWRQASAEGQPQDVLDAIGSAGAAAKAAAAA